MLGRQTKLVEAFQRTVQFVKAHVPPNANAGNGSYAKLGRALELAVAELEQAASDQALGRRVSQAATRAVYASVKRLRDWHLKPLAVIARAVAEDEPGISRAVRMPRRRIGVTRLSAEARGMRDSARKYEQLFVANGRDSAFLSQLDQAIETMEAAFIEQARMVGHQVSATAAVAQGIRRARRLVMLLECQIVTGYEEDDVALAEWRTAKRVHLKQGGGRREEVEEVTVNEEREMVLEAGSPMLAIEAPKPLMIAAPRVEEKVAA